MLFLVADGMGGHGAGDIASAAAVESIPQVYYGLGDDYSEIEERLELAVQIAHQRILEDARQSVETKNMGTTIVAVVVKYEEARSAGQCCVAWAGDSRVYRLRQGQLEQLTQDHSRIWPLIEAGQLTWDQLRLHPERSKITNALTAQRRDLSISLRYFDLAPGDQLLLCSDGLSGEVRPEEIRQILLKHPPAEAVDRLIEKANTPKVVQAEGQVVALEGGDDNITAIVIELPGGQPRRVEPVTLVRPAPPRPSKVKPYLIGALALLGLIGVGAFFLVMTMGVTVGNSTANSRTGDEVAAQAGSAAAPASTQDKDAAPVRILVAEAERLPTLTEGPTPRSEGTAQVTSAGLTPTTTRGPLSSPTVPPTATPPPTATATPSATPTPEAPGTRELSVPVLVEPVSYSLNLQQHNVDSEIKFSWIWPGELSDDLSFEIRVWLPGSRPEGVHDARLLKQDPTFQALDGDKYSVTLTLRGARGLKGTSSDYFWSVGVVRIEPGYEWLNLEADPRNISLIVPKDSTGSNRGGN
jgi:serine/threonine protein phosphatase PrpC